VNVLPLLVCPYAKMVAAKQTQGVRGQLQMITPLPQMYKLSINLPLMPVNADIATSLAPSS
jgi:hypothetical protein